ncbi:MAG TPA: hypothetical protein VFB37_07230 [Steroidobacteraceae bacterium]|nr:hypothetical protein [Steroidobacteraceae bacterium]
MGRRARQNSRLSRAPAKGVRVPYADLEPGIITLLRAIRGCQHRLRTGDVHPVQAQRLRWALEALDNIVVDWDKTENLNELKTALGVQSNKKRRRNATVRAETNIAVALVNAAVSGNTEPFEAVANQLDLPIERVTRAWRTWQSFYIAQLNISAGKNPEQRRAARAAIDRLKKSKHKL